VVVEIEKSGAWGAGEYILVAATRTRSREQQLITREDFVATGLIGGELAK